MTIREKVDKFFKARDERLSQMSEMLQVTDAGSGLERGRCSEYDIRSMLSRCLRCDNPDICKQWLVNAQAKSQPPEFCPNRDAMLRLKAGGQSRDLGA